MSLFMAEDCPDEVTELTDTLLAEDGIGFAVKLGGVTGDHLLIAGMVRVFRYT